jgi:hypothetical protein
MEFKKTTSFSYHIEQKPEGGFIARPDDATMETLEGATEQEVEQKIGAKVTGMISAQMPFGMGKLLDLAMSKAEFAYHIEENPGGGFIARPKDSSHEPLEGATRQEVEDKIRGTLQALIGQQLSGMGKSGDATVTRKFNVGDHTTFSFSTYSATQSSEQKALYPGLSQGDDSMSPIQPEKDNSGRILMFLVVLFAIAALVYFGFLRH